MKVVQDKPGDEYIDVIYKAINKANKRGESVLLVLNQPRDNVFTFVVKPGMEFEDLHDDFMEWNLPHLSES